MKLVIAAVITSVIVILYFQFECIRLVSTYHFSSDIHKALTAKIAKVQTFFISKSPNIYNVSVSKSSSQRTKCSFLDGNRFDPHILKITDLDEEPLACSQDYLPEITYFDYDKLIIRVNSSKVKGTSGLSHCRYRSILMSDEDTNSMMYSNWSKPFTQFMGITQQDEIVFVECYGWEKERPVISKAFYSLVPRRWHLETLYKNSFRKRQKEFRPKESLNVIGLMVDGLSRHQMIRALPKTYKLLTVQLKSFDFKVHGQTGEESLPNMLSLLSANTQQDGMAAWWNTLMPLDIFYLLWHDYQKAGYWTMSSDDSPDGEGSYWGGHSFTHPQTTYWSRPLSLAMLGEPGFLRRDGFCAGSRPMFEYQVDHLRRFVDSFSAQPFIAIAVITVTTQGGITHSRLIDQHLVNFYQKLADGGHLNKSLVMFFSNRGAPSVETRQTFNSIVERKNPFLFLTFPPWFIEKYPDIARNLDSNTHRLTSHPDTRQMLLDLLYFKGREPTPPYRGRHGVSLFQEIPANRTCKNASIPEDQCLCEQKIDNFIRPTSSRAKTFAKALLKAVQKKSDPEKCEEYRLGKVLLVGALDISTAPWEETKRYIVCTVRITVEPGRAMFEGTVVLDRETNKYDVIGNIERLNTYKGGVQCQPTAEDKMFCYCKDNKAVAHTKKD